MNDNHSLAINADLIITELRSRGIPDEYRGKIKKFKVNSAFLATLALASYLGFAFLESVLNPGRITRLDIAAFQAYPIITIFIVTALVLCISLMIAVAAVQLSHKAVNTDDLEIASQLSEIGKKIIVAEEISRIAREPSLEIAEAFVKSNVDWLNDKISFLSLMTVISAFLTGALSFVRNDDLPSKFIASCVIWVLFLVRIDSVARLYIFRDWLAILSITKSLLKKH